MTHEFIGAAAEVLQQLDSLCVLKKMMTLFTTKFIEELMVKPPPSAPPGIRAQKHKMVVVKNQIIRYI
jgi:hypothetical protein